jgi:surface carbohydrate biosynthesis protein
MPRSVDIVIIYEKVHRELDVACALKVMAEQRGLSVAIVHNFDIGNALQNYLPRLVLLPYCYQNRSNNIFLMRWRDAIFVNMTWEQFFYPGNKKAKTPRGIFPLRHVLHFSWSKAYSDLLTEAGVPATRIIQTGNPALALYADKYRGYFKQRRELAEAYGLDPAKKWVFFPENYNWAFYEEAMLRQMVADGQSEAEVDSMRTFSTRTFNTAMDWCRRLVAEGGIELILRPRPSTVPEIMRTRVEELVGPLPAGFHVLQAETVREWILASDHIISSHSTTLIESAIAGRQILLLEPYPIPPARAEGWHQLAPKIETYDQLKAGLASSQPESSAILSGWARQTLLGGGDPLGEIFHLLCRLGRGQLVPPERASRESVTYGTPAFLPWQVWWLWKYIRSFVSQYRALVARRPIPSDDMMVDMAESETISARCARWRICLAPKNHEDAQRVAQAG